MANRIEVYTRDSIRQRFQIKHDGEPLVLDAADTVTAGIIGDGWVSNTVTLDLEDSEADLANGWVVVEFSETETAAIKALPNYSPGKIVWELERTPAGTTAPQTYRYANSVMHSDEI